MKPSEVKTAPPPSVAGRLPYTTQNCTVILPIPYPATCIYDHSDSECDTSVVSYTRHAIIKFIIPGGQRQCDIVALEKTEGAQCKFGQLCKLVLA